MRAGSRNWVASLFNTIADSGRDLLARDRNRSDIGALCHDLLSLRGEASGMAIAREVMQRYADLDDAARAAFFLMLRDEFGQDREAVLAAAEAYREHDDEESMIALAHAVESPRQELIRRLNMAPHGTEALVDMRTDLLACLADDRRLAAVDNDLRHLLASWFNRGFLEMRAIDWSTPAETLEKLIAYEAVHEIQGWDDLRRRLAEDRRCFAFFHPALPDDPLIFVQVALTRGIARSVQTLLEEPVDETAEAEADTAIFYSISNCQRGLAGISFGNFLIKQVVADLRRELPQIKTFSTLSPVPGFRRWLADAVDHDVTPGGVNADMLARIDEPGWLDDGDTAAAVETPLRRACANYLVHAKRGDQPRDPVARFHLGNGATLGAVNWRGDVSDKGIAQSASIMVNYVYDLATIERNHERLVNTGEVVASSEVEKLAGPGPGSRKAANGKTG
ncbi:MAG: malonyl-CoA decarboxylase [Alphaproteobacteria bacterium]|jgi:malonyl-CoA decarboxylase